MHVLISEFVFMKIRCRMWGNSYKEIVMESSDVVVEAIPLKTRLLRGAAAFVPLTGVAVWSFFDGEYLKCMVWSFISVGLTLWFYSVADVRHYEMKTVETVNSKGKTVSVSEYTAEGAAAKALAEQIAIQKNREWEDRVLKIWWVRYLMATGFGVAAYYLNQFRPNLWWVAVIIAITAACYAWELTLAVIGIALLIWIGSLVLPITVPVAIIIGAIIIAATINNRN